MYDLYDVARVCHGVVDRTAGGRSALAADTYRTTGTSGWPDRLHLSQSSPRLDRDQLDCGISLPAATFRYLLRGIHLKLVF